MSSQMENNVNNNNNDDAMERPPTPNGIEDMEMEEVLPVAELTIEPGNSNSVQADTHKSPTVTMSAERKALATYVPLTPRLGAGS